MAEKQISPTTKDFVEVADIRDTVVILKNGSLRSLIEVGAINFELKSSDEQTAIVQAFQNFLNTLDFPLQILISSRKLDINPYLKYINEVIEKQTNELLRIQAQEYSRAVKGLTELAFIMSKKFYAVIPFYVVEVAPSQKGFASALKSVLSPAKFARTLTDEELENYKVQLNQRIDLTREGIDGMGLNTRILAGEELKNIFYSYYSPQ